MISMSYDWDGCERFVSLGGRFGPVAHGPWDCFASLAITIAVRPKWNALWLRLGSRRRGSTRRKESREEQSSHWNRRPTQTCARAPARLAAYDRLRLSPGPASASARPTSRSRMSIEAVTHREDSAPRLSFGLLGERATSTVTFTSTSDAGASERCTPSVSTAAGSRRGRVAPSAGGVSASATSCADTEP